MKNAIRAMLPDPAWSRLKQTGRRAHRAFHQKLRPYGPQDIVHALRTLGISRGDIVMAHSGWNHLIGFQGGPGDLIDALMAAVGPDDGTLLMPTIPFGGSAIDYAMTDPLFNYRRTPSRMGLVTEVFRRGRDVQRSLHPTHSVAARGTQADTLLGGHHLANDPCGEGTPWFRLVDAGGKILFIGVPTTTNTILHGIQAVLGPEWSGLHPEISAPLGGLTQERYELRTLLPSAEEFVCETHLFDREHVAYMRGDRVAEWLKATGRLKVTKVKGLRLCVMNARDIFDEVERRGRRREFIFDLDAYVADRR